MKYLIIILLLAACQVKDPAPVRMNIDTVMLLKSYTVAPYEADRRIPLDTTGELRHCAGLYLNDSTYAAVCLRSDTAVLIFPFADTLLKKGRYISVNDRTYTLQP